MRQDGENKNGVEFWLHLNQLVHSGLYSVTTVLKACAMFEAICSMGWLVMCCYGVEMSLKNDLCSWVKNEVTPVLLRFLDSHKILKWYNQKVAKLKAAQPLFLTFFNTQSFVSYCALSFSFTTFQATGAGEWMRLRKPWWLLFDMSTHSKATTHCGIVYHSVVCCLG